MIPDGNRRAVSKWIGRGSWSILDQGLFAVSNFGLNVALARWLTPQAYGQFSVAYTVFLLLGTVHTAVISEPMLVFGPGRYQERVTTYLKVLVRGHWTIGVVSSLTLGLCAFVVAWLGNPQLATALFSVAMSAPLILLQWMMRRACYLDLRPRLAALSGAIYMAILALGIATLYSAEILSTVASFLLMGVASLVSAAWLSHRLGIRRGLRSQPNFRREVLNDHRTYGRWAVGSAVLSWVPGNFFYLLLPIRSGIEVAGTLRALMNLVMPILHANTALGIILLPTLVKARNTGRRSLVRAVTIAASVLGAGAVTYGALLFFLGHDLIKVVYGASNHYADSAGALRLLALLPVVSAVSIATSATLRAQERPKMVFWGYLGSASTAATVGGLIVLFMWGVGAAAAGVVLSATIAAGITATLVVGRVLRERTGGAG